MDQLALHPRFKDVKDECELFPDHAEQLFQVYLDLTLAKEFEDVSVIRAPALGRCLIECTHPDTRVRYLILPVFVTEPWTVAKMESTFSALDKEPDARLKTPRITLGVISGDSTTTYINLTRGVPPEKPDAGAAVVAAPAVPVSP